MSKRDRDRNRTIVVVKEGSSILGNGNGGVGVGSVGMRNSFVKNNNNMSNVHNSMGRSEWLR